MSTTFTPPPSWPTLIGCAYQGWVEYHRTVTGNPWVKKEPTALPDGTVHHGPHPRQQEFLLLSATREVFFGGAGGGGKSQSLLYGALQYADTPGYAAIILRRKYTD